MANVELTWDPRPAEENVLRYEIERRPIGPSQNDSRTRRNLYNLWGRNIMGGWRRIGEVPGTEHTFTDAGRMLVRRFFRPTYTHNSEVLPYQSYEYQIRAVNANGAGNWFACRVNAIGTTPPPTPPTANTPHIASINGGAAVNNLGVDRNVIVTGLRFNLVANSEIIESSGNRISPVPGLVIDNATQLHFTVPQAWAVGDYTLVLYNASGNVNSGNGDFQITHGPPPSNVPVINTVNGTSPGVSNNRLGDDPVPVAGLHLDDAVMFRIFTDNGAGVFNVPFAAHGASGNIGAGTGCRFDNPAQLTLTVRNGWPEGEYCLFVYNAAGTHNTGSGRFRIDHSAPPARFIRGRVIRQNPGGIVGVGGIRVEAVRLTQPLVPRINPLDLAPGITSQANGTFEIDISTWGNGALDDVLVRTQRNPANEHHLNIPIGGNPNTHLNISANHNYDFPIGHPNELRVPVIASPLSDEWFIVNDPNDTHDPLPGIPLNDINITSNVLFVRSAAAPNTRLNKFDTFIHHIEPLTKVGGIMRIDIEKDEGSPISDTDINTIRALLPNFLIIKYNGTIINYSTNINININKVSPSKSRTKIGTKLVAQFNNSGGLFTQLIAAGITPGSTLLSGTKFKIVISVTPNPGSGLTNTPKQGRFYCTLVNS